MSQLDAAAGPAPPMPPGPAMPVAVQTLLWMFRPLPFMERCRARHGDVFTVSLPLSGGVVNICDPQLIRTVFADRGDRLHAGEANIVLQPVLGSRSVLLLDGPEHMRQRKLMLPSFHGERMQRHGPLIAGITARRVQGWPTGRVFPLRSEFQEITLDVILRAVFGLAEGERLTELRASLSGLLASGRNRLAMLPPLQRPLGGLSPWARLMRARAACDRLLYAEIRRRRAAPDLAERDDVLSLLLLARDEQGREMTDVELRDELITLLLAGHETTATSLAWLFDLVLHEPAAMRRLEAEVLQGGGGTAWLDACITEAMRLRPVVPVVARRLTEPLDLGGWRLPAGSYVAPNILLTHRRADTYPEPLRFRPERFLDSRADSFAWLPFGGGIRRCLGAAFATFEMRTVVPEVIRQVRLRPAGHRPEPIRRRGITLVPGRGTRVIAERR
ncbi:MAG TPA: cytochrome P450 [Candidatus Dormibacteraeota bacterium]|nr:cytochrome P450 [Candidatus Dormibacteraeota bacterium]